MRLLNIVTSPRRERSASIAVIDSFLLEYQKRIKGVVVDTLDVWTESLGAMSPLDRRSRTVPLAAGWTYVSL
jgi:FMN-dependent NADH-azoreductase